MEQKSPEKILWKAVYGMLPKNRVYFLDFHKIQLREERINRLRIYMTDAQHHSAQVRDTDWNVWHLRDHKEPRSEDALLSAPSNKIPEELSHCKDVPSHDFELIVKWVRELFPMMSASCDQVIQYYIAKSDGKGVSPTSVHQLL